MRCHLFLFFDRQITVIHDATVSCLEVSLLVLRIHVRQWIMDIKGPTVYVMIFNSRLDSMIFWVDILDFFFGTSYYTCTWYLQILLAAS